VATTTFRASASPGISSNMPHMVGQWTRQQLDADLALFALVLHVPQGKQRIQRSSQEAMTAAGIKPKAQKRLVGALLVAEKLQEVEQEIPAHGRVILWDTGWLELRAHVTRPGSES